MSEDKAPVLIDRPEPGVAVVRLNRPEARNALNMATRRALADAFTALAEDTEVRAIVLTGDEAAFAAGADLKEFVDADPVEIAKRRVERLWAAISSTPQPIIAAVNGYALGGGLELAMMTDIIVAGESAQLGQPEVRVGIMPGAGGTQRLTRAVGKYHAMRLCLTGKPIAAPEAHAIGLVSQVVPDAEVFETALAMAKSIAKMPPLAVVAVKESILQAENSSLEAGLALERKAFQLLFASKDKSEGMTAFLEKRRPSFTGE
ncbi:enoyl-CoA hydratase-related protein [Amorphus orientalis]|uniref:Enoyl-CoA hydratase/carnithine racemase n=1 Tax=Amorphus orientalis TaxID=649198 RepID=A0AAE3VSI4_9HYPH|nr:enoyl-CoA hydratase-related protein [Amorphus orientalis]MDQ0317552.1 enoyl-CoA hydratase/carnithine racemase [Amorphus orientalis]